MVVGGFGLLIVDCVVLAAACASPPYNKDVLRLAECDCKRGGERLIAALFTNAQRRIAGLATVVYVFHDRQSSLGVWPILDACTMEGQDCFHHFSHCIW